MDCGRGRRALRWAVLRRIEFALSPQRRHVCVPARSLRRARPRTAGGLFVRLATALLRSAHTGQRVHRLRAVRGVYRSGSGAAGDRPRHRARRRRGDAARALPHDPARCAHRARARQRRRTHVARDRRQRLHPPDASRGNLARAGLFTQGLEHRRARRRDGVHALRLRRLQQRPAARRRGDGPGAHDPPRGRAVDRCRRDYVRGAQPRRLFGAAAR